MKWLHLHKPVGLDWTGRSPLRFLWLFTLAFLLACGTGTPPQVPAISPSPTGETGSTRAQEVSMVAIPGGTYTLGSVTGMEDVQPVHSVSLSSFRLDRYEVTNAQYAEFLNALNIQPLQNAPAGNVGPADLAGPDAALLLEGAEGREQSPLLIALDDEHARIAIQDGRFVPQAGFEDHPVTETTWRGARDFCQWRGARLPTEAEWEVAARGTAGHPYPWGEEPPDAQRAIFNRSSGQTEAVGQYPAGATPEGIHDLAGNVAEWTSSLYRPYPYDPNDGREDLESGGERVTRGGDHVFDSSPDTLTTYYRRGFSRAPERGHRHIGFRCAQSA